MLQRLLAAAHNVDIKGRLNTFRDAAGLQTAETDPTVIAGRIIRSLLVILGTLFFVQMVYAGYLWMTARGDETVVEKAKDTIQRNLIGFVIMMAAYAITSFVVNRLTSATVGG